MTAPTPKINYPVLMNNAMRGLIASILRGVADKGLPDKHHFYIQFDTQADGVLMADSLRHAYPEKMTVIIQDWYENLQVNEADFQVTLNFDNQAEPLVIPFASILSFADPSVEFVLQFQRIDMQSLSEDNPMQGSKSPAKSAKLASKPAPKATPKAPVKAASKPIPPNPAKNVLSFKDFKKP